MGLRYINKFDFDTNKIKLKDYFNLLYNLPSDLPQTKAFQVRVEIPFQHDVLVMAMHDTKLENQNSISIILDLYYVNNQKGKIPQDNIMAWMNKAHGNLKAVFLKSITEKTKRILNEG